MVPYGASHENGYTGILRKIQNDITRTNSAQIQPDGTKTVGKAHPRTSRAIFDMNEYATNGKDSIISGFKPNAVIRFPLKS